MSREIKAEISIIELEEGDLPVFPSNAVVGLKDFEYKNENEFIVPMESIDGANARKITEFIAKYGVSPYYEATIVVDNHNRKVGFFAIEKDGPK